MSWMTTTLGAIAPLAYGRALTASQRDETGSVPVVASGGIVGRHTSACTTGPVVVLGRKGSVGTVPVSYTHLTLPTIYSV